MRFTDRIPIELYQGSVIAFGSYGAPTLSRRTLGKAALLLTLLAIVGGLYFAGIIDSAGLLLGTLIVPIGGTGSAADLKKELAGKREVFNSWYTDAKASGDMDAAEFQKRNAELNDLAGKLEAAESEEKAVEHNLAEIKRLNAPLGRQVDPRTVEGGDINPELGKQLTPTKSLGEMFVESPAFKEFKEAGKPKGNIEITKADLDEMYGKGRGFKTLFDTASSFPVQSVRLAEPIVPNAQQPTIASLMAEGRTSQPSIAYMEETTTTTGAAETAESGSKPEAALAFTERTSAVRKIAVSLPVTDESFEDIPFLESYLDSRLTFFVIAREDSQLLNGNGTPPNLRGLLNVSGIGTQATGVDKNQDAILKAIVATQVASYLDADAVVINPLNWQTMILDKDDVGAYLFGPPNGPAADRVWGYRMVRTTAIASGTALVGAFRAGAQVFRRTGLSLQVGWINDQFVKNQRTIVVEERLALVPFRPAAFTKVTGLN